MKTIFVPLAMNKLTMNALNVVVVIASTAFTPTILAMILTMKTMNQKMNNVV
jgi:hypothetical protein